MGSFAVDTALRAANSDPSSSVVVPEPIRSQPAESFDSHLSRDPATKASPPETPRDEQHDDERADSATAAAAAPPSPPAQQDTTQSEDQEVNEKTDSSETDETQAKQTEDAPHPTRSAKAKQPTRGPKPLDPFAVVTIDNQEKVTEPAAQESVEGVAKDEKVEVTPLAVEALAEKSLEGPVEVDNKEETVRAAPRRTESNAQKVDNADELMVTTELVRRDQPTPATPVESPQPSLPASERRPTETKKSRSVEPSSIEPVAGARPVTASDLTPVPVLPVESEASEVERLSRSATRAESGDANAPASINRGVESAAMTPQSRFAQHLVNHSEDRTGRGVQLNEADQSRFIDRVARAFRAAENREGTVKLRLHPPELGSLRIELRVQNGALTARLEAETTMAQSLLLEHAHALRDRLSEQGVRVERFDVDLTDRRSMSHSGSFEQRPTRDGTPTGQQRRDEQPLPLSDADNARAPKSLPVPGKLNVII